MFVFWLVGHNLQKGLSKHFLLTLKVQNLKISLVSLARVKAYGTYLAGELKIDNEKSNENNVVHFEICKTNCDNVYFYWRSNFPHASLIKVGLLVGWWVSRSVSLLKFL